MKLLNPEVAFVVNSKSSWKMSPHQKKTPRHKNTYTPNISCLISIIYPDFPVIMPLGLILGPWIYFLLPNQYVSFRVYILSHILAYITLRFGYLSKRLLTKEIYTKMKAMSWQNVYTSFQYILLQLTSGTNCAAWLNTLPSSCYIHKAQHQRFPNYQT